MYQIDAVAKGRDGRLRSVGNDEREQTLNQLLTVCICGSFVFHAFDACSGYMAFNAKLLLGFQLDPF
jgi:hypothetical protein